jgi:predicted amidophosphoribosyltransferase
MYEIKTLPCGHQIEEGKKWCPACTKHVARIKYGEPGICPSCNKSYPIDRYNFYIEKKL